jgi:hypothetical protein
MLRAVLPMEELALRLIGAIRFPELTKSQIQKSKHHELPNLLDCLDAESTLRSIINDGRSLARFGDGELRLAFLQGSSVYESLSLRKSLHLREVLSSAHKDLLIGFNLKFLSSPNWQLLNTPNLPQRDVFELLSFKTPNDIRVFRRVPQHRELNNFWQYLKRYFPETSFCEASVFRRELFVQSYLDDRLVELRDILRDFFRRKSILVIAPSGEDNSTSELLTILSVGDWKSRRLTHIPITKKNTFKSIDEIFSQVKLQLSGHDLVIIKAGATATILTGWITEQYNIQTLDIGNFNWHQL